MGQPCDLKTSVTAVTHCDISITVHCFRAALALVVKESPLWL